ncbi:deoxyribodipyrimidine photo-lyase [Halovulum dunhuangense]|uniref:Deoxyribodipyrimidine photo-lyase n=1 Tax=Halovulum dunhuangense TaxID=1505036 RepID=A0A849L1C1_9RHOB|nr:deoxyribodipyrimidine photo-lyase [Halovulum dunhuangense]NNU80047.1 deoxyribodipyrimidine photo-lyase [Halovulum dunhuangense]
MTPPTLFWFRRDLRLADHPGLVAAIARGGPVIPVFILDPQTETLGAAPRWRLGEGVASFARSLEALGSRLILRRGDAARVLAALAAETGATAVHWSRLCDPVSKARDAGVKAQLRDRGLEAVSHPGHLLFEPWTVQTGQGGFYRVYTPYWRAVRDRDPGDCLPAPARLPAPDAWPASDSLSDWALGAAMRRGADIVAAHARIGEDAARARLDAFLEQGIAGYSDLRDRLDLPGTSKLGENLSLGEVSVRACWHAARAAMERGAPGAETFLQEIVWRDFAHHLVHHTPHITERNWREEWDGFPWAGESEHATRWKRGLTGEPVIDAAMREMYVTGTMHNRARMLVASYLTKHLMTDWRVGLKWFEDCLIDWDPASNAMGWQWAAGSGPDAAPFFRIFNPATQAEKFDPKSVYRRTWVAELSRQPGKDALDYFRAVPESWAMTPSAPYPKPLVDLKKGRERALDAYHAHRDRSAA